MFEQVYRHTTKIIAAIYLVMAALLLWAGTQPDGYLINVRHIIEPQPYPVSPVLIALLMLVVPYAMFAWALRSHSWTRVWKLLLCFIADVTLIVLTGITMMHAPPYHAYFLLAVLLLTLLVLLTLLLFTSLGSYNKWVGNTGI
ncbi:hypothetical protein [Undibacterium pigrum]|uniref:Uncharacterized protein n=1 Tax=Undibacterium pigrum TaxID=401470 RepID=A0A318J722_9BURK|nr:hypothetical protein [Undibacterium pigrum]PXX39708.1 hypothetical protein DFR42_11073 [Undibacterium pigrum]